MRNTKKEEEVDDVCDMKDERHGRLLPFQTTK
jgi:hypothetical protein